MDKEEFDRVEDTGWDGPRDWRGKPIGVFTKVIYRSGHSSWTEWKIGTVIFIRPGDLLDIEWSEESFGFETRIARRVDPRNVTVFNEGPN